MIQQHSEVRIMNQKDWKTRVTFTVSPEIVKAFNASLGYSSRSAKIEALIKTYLKNKGKAGKVPAFPKARESSRKGRSAIV